MAAHIARTAGEALTKDNFWNVMAQRYPDAVRNFWTWIDRYQSRHDWDFLFWNFSRPKSTQVSFQELPLAMQAGILMEYLEHTGKTNPAAVQPTTIEGVIEWLPGHFAFLQEQALHDVKPIFKF